MHLPVSEFKWEEMKNFPPSKTGSPRIRLEGKSHWDVHVSI